MVELDPGNIAKPRDRIALALQHQAGQRLHVIKPAYRAQQVAALALVNISGRKVPVAGP